MTSVSVISITLFAPSTLTGFKLYVGEDTEVTVWLILSYVTVFSKTAEVGVANPVFDKS